ncbi:photosystem I subunit D-2 [Hibiscus trionum]|uniref:Photosystem I reaction center subunit II, chloroplastic n=1 Tax=Hibiscus trionum TaxID=183268 RepID=A0A9W7MHA6_HIBTR|nr:photosystem I subunit D-2 [Hibiscus trionum]
MAMATQASLFTPTTLHALKIGDRVAVPWKQSSLAEATKEKSELTTVTKEAPVGFTPPELDPNTPSPIFGGSTGGLLCKAQVEEFYVITWELSKEQIFEMPTGSAAIMRQGPNLLKLARKEQCLALGTRLRSKYKIKYQFYRNFRSIGKNVSPIEVKFTGKQVYDL